MAEAKVPYLFAYGNITRALQGIQKAQTPERFTQDFLGTKLGLSGGGARPVISFLKRAGMLAADGTPTELYKRFRNTKQAGAAAAQALRNAYGPLYAINEYVHSESDSNLRGIVVQVTGGEENSSVVKATVSSFKALRDFADFDVSLTDIEEDEGEVKERVETRTSRVTGMPEGLNLGYTINLHLPATSDIAVFNAIFKSLRDHLLE